MIAAFFPLKKLRRSGKHLLLGVILLVGLVAVYHEMVAERAWSSASRMHPDANGINLRKAVFGRRVKGHHQVGPLEDSARGTFNSTPQTWKPEYKGQANLHVFEDWCGSSTADLFKNLHYPLYPHSRTTVQKLAVSPQWTNYGLRIFGYLHPYTHGEFVFAVSSDDNSELWLSTDDSPNNLQLLAWVGKTGREWTAPGEFEKYASQTSRPIRLSAQRKYFFEVIHKQNDRGTDHVEVAWKLPKQLGFDMFRLIESSHISLYVNESALLMSDVAHIPQTAASHQNTPTKEHSAAADMLREDPRDSFYQVPLINSKFLHGVLPDCLYKPSYTIKDFPLLRYQGLQFIYMSYIYPNDYTRLTHMETENSCFYHESSFYKTFRSSKYMKLDRPENENRGREFGFQRRKSVLSDKNANYIEARPDQKDNDLFSDYGDDYDDYARNRRRKLFSVVTHQTNNILKNTSDTGLQPQSETPEPAEPLQTAPTQASNHHLVPLQQNLLQVKLQGQADKEEEIKPEGKLGPIKTEEASVRPGQIDPPSLIKGEQLTAKLEPGVLSEKQDSELKNPRKITKTQIQRPKESKKDPHLTENLSLAKQLPANAESLSTAKRDRPIARLQQRHRDIRINRKNKKIQMNTPLQKDSENSIHKANMITRGQIKNWSSTKRNEDQAKEKDEVFNWANRRRDPLWGQHKDYADIDDDEDDDEAVTAEPVFDTEVNWSQTFQVLHHDVQAQRSDLMDTQCNIAGNLLLQSSDVLPIVSAFMKKFNEKHNGQFSLERVVNVVKRVDRAKGSRYLLELELKDVNGKLFRLSHYIYTLVYYSMQGINDFQQQKSQQLLCNPVGFRWNPDATVHFILPVKNQARWVLQLIADMEQLYEETGDNNFNLIITDFSSTDIDVRKALQKSKIPRYQYVKLEGNFERSAGLQAGIDLIDDDHSILFLCDLHIFFPSYIINAIRKHCVEGYMAFAPIVMRLDCGATPAEAKGYWEANGFGLLGIYKSDMDTVGGMNTKEFKDRWGGEDWELLDRILQAGLEVERIYLRSFFHHYHSKRGMWNRRVSPSHK